MRKTLTLSFWLVICLLVTAFAFTIVGSSFNLGGLLSAGIAGWIISSTLAFAWFVLWAWSKRRKYGSSARSAGGRKGKY